MSLSLSSCLNVASQYTVLGRNDNGSAVEVTEGEIGVDDVVEMEIVVERH